MTLMMSRYAVGEACAEAVSAGGGMRFGLQPMMSQTMLGQLPGARNGHGAAGAAEVPEVEGANGETMEGICSGMNGECGTGEHAFGWVEAGILASLSASEAGSETDPGQGAKAAVSEVDRIELALARLREAGEAFEARLDAAPLTQPCRVGAGHGEAVLDREASFKAVREVYVCPVCADTSPQGRLQRRMEAVGIPRDVRHATLENFATDRPEVETGEGLLNPAKFLAKARLFAEGGVRNLLLAGPPGIGKGHLAAALAIRELALGRSVRWTDCARLFKELHRSYEDGSTERLIRAHSEVTLLVLDELCLRDLPADGEEILFAILDARHKAARRTILLGNRPARATREWLGYRLLDRLRSGGIAFCYGEWTSMRGTPGDGAM